MSKEYVRQLVSRKFSEFSHPSLNSRSYPNHTEAKTPSIGLWARLDIEFVTATVASIGATPCVRRTGVIAIEVRGHLHTGSSQMTVLTDALEEHFQFMNVPQFTTDAANTVNSPPKNIYYESIVYIPFTYDPVN